MTHLEIVDDHSDKLLTICLTKFIIQSHVHNGYMSGGAGYAFSRATLKLLVEKAIDKHSACPTYDEDMEDVKISKFSLITFFGYSIISKSYLLYIS